MRTFVLLGVATVSLVLAGRAGAEAPAVESRAVTDLAGSASFSDHTKPALDYGAPADADVRVYTGHADRIPSESEYRRVSGYDAEGRWTGTWSGTYEAPDGRRYDGTYEENDLILQAIRADGGAMIAAGDFNNYRAGDRGGFFCRRSRFPARGERRRTDGARRCDHRPPGVGRCL